MAPSLADRLLAGAPPAQVRAIEARVLMGAFARAFGVEAPSARGLSAEGALELFREFTAACMEMAEGDGRLIAYLRGQLGAQAIRLGRAVRAAVPLADAMELARYAYRGIGIELSGEMPGELRFGPCSFAQRYTPHDCYLMSAFDEGFLRGISDCDDADLVFSCRLTEGACCCKAHLLRAKAQDGGR